jgi:hypothetical protein
MPADHRLRPDEHEVTASIPPHHAGHHPEEPVASAQTRPPAGGASQDGEQVAAAPQYRADEADSTYSNIAGHDPGPRHDLGARFVPRQGVIYIRRATDRSRTRMSDGRYLHPERVHPLVHGLAWCDVRCDD